MAQQTDIVSTENNQSTEKKAKITEVVSLDMDTDGETPVDLDAETTADLLQDAQKEDYIEEIGRYTDSAAIQEILAERQDLNTGQEQMQERLDQHHAKSPTLSGGDVDAAWDDANVGEETVGGIAPTPDQDMVEEIGEAYGITYEEGEPLRTGEKLAERDEHRWELDPESAP